jgi:alkylation response protein AidB-like acyl-CoA dehydrogenase
MQFSLTEEQRLIRDTARSFFAERVPNTAVRAALATEAGYDAGLWSQVTQEMGWGAVALPEAEGGAGLGQVELALVMMEMGRCLFPSPFLPSIGLALPALLHAGTAAQRQRWLPGIADGTTIATLAHSGGARRPQGDGIEVTLSPQGGGWRLDGIARLVPFAHVAGLILVAARGPGAGTSLLVVPAGTPGLTVERHATLDLTRPLCTVRLDGVTVAGEQLLGEPGGAAPALALALDLGRVALAAEQAGAAEAVLDQTVAYTKTRVQFGRPVGSFQALKHRMADMMVEVETAKTAALYAACTADENPAGLVEAAAIAKAYCSDAFLNSAGNAIQLHGGVGFTWDIDAHLYFRRARATATMLGDADQHRERIAQMLEGAH